MSTARHTILGLSPEEKRALLTRLLKDDHLGRMEQLSSQQQRYWVLHQMVSTIPTHVTVAYDVRGSLDIALMQTAMRGLIEQTEILRAAFVGLEGQPRRIVTPTPRINIPIVDLTNIEPTREQSELELLSVQEARCEFQLAVSPLLRVTVARLAADQHVVFMTAHQLVADRASLRVLAHQLAAGCGTAGNQERWLESKAPEAQYEEFASQQSGWLETSEAEASLAYWRKRLAGTPVLGIPTDYPRPAVKAGTLMGARRRSVLSESLAESISVMGQRLGSDSFTVLLAAFTSVLGRYSGQRDFAVGWPVPNRSEASWEGAIGPFENTLVLRADLSGDPSFGELIERLEQVREEAQKHADLPLGHLIEQLQLNTEVAHSPLFQVQMRWEEERLEVEAGTLLWKELALETGLSAFDLTLSVRPRRGGLELEAEYSSELFEAATVERLLGHLEVLLEVGVAEPQRRISALPLLRESERMQIVEEWNATEAAYPRERCLHQLVEEQARRTPHAVAVTARERQLSYRELDEQANGLAHQLHHLGVGPEVLVGVVAERTVSTIVALLGVLKAGGAYVPLDPEYPAERLQFMLRDAAIGVVIARAAIAVRLPFDSVQVVDLADDIVPAGAGPNVKVHSDNLAYVIYTSGSTGKPKAVLTAHRQIVNSTFARLRFFEEPISSYLMLAPVTFDASAAGLYWTLSTGARLVFPSENDVVNMPLLARLIKQYEVSHLDGVPSQYSILLESEKAALDGLRCCILAGEVLPPAVVSEHYRAAPRSRLYNEYGPTEATVWASAFQCKAEDIRFSVPIGRPIQNVRLYVLDGDLNPQPVGVPGEIHIGGEGLARGYLNQPSLTAERFVPNPFDGASGERMYRTGDFARYLPDGNLEFLGRADAQVKVRGFRIELGEVELALQSYPVIAAAAVTVREERPGDIRLTAFVVPRADRPDLNELIDFLRRKLPAYMIPAQFVFLNELPLNSYGKLDRVALVSKGRPVNLSTPFEPPTATVEREVAQVFAEVLGIERVGLNDDFFALGGNSLLIARVGARLSTAYGVDLPLHSIFTLPTVAGVSHIVDLYRKGGYQSVLAERDPSTLVTEAVLDPAISPEGLPMADIDNPAAVLLTGATGYLGIFVLQELIRQTGSDVYCLVRASNATEAMARLRQTASTFKVQWDNTFDERVRLVVGDLSKPLFGLTPASFARLAETVDAIYHDGALVNFVYPYSVLRGPNVQGTIEVLRLACQVKAKIVHHVSTIDVLVGSHIPRPFLEHDLPQHPPRMPFSYPQSKWIAEKIIVTARSRGVPVTIIRPSMIMGHSETGACHKTDYIITGLRGFLELGILPQYDEILHAMTVDFASRALVHLTRQKSSAGQIFHLWNCDSLPTVWTYDWVRSFGYDFDIVPFDEALDRAMQVDPSHPIYPLLPVLLLYKSGDAGLPMDWEAHKAIDARAECSNTLNAIDGAGIQCPVLNEKWMHDCLEFLIERREIAPPRAYRMHSFGT